MAYEWLIIGSEPNPNNNREVIVWVDIDEGYWVKGYYEDGCWWNDNGVKLKMKYITHWKNIKGPE